MMTAYNYQWQYRKGIHSCVNTNEQCCEISKLHLTTGWLHLKLVDKVNEGNMAAESGQGGGAKSGVGAAIDRLEEHSSKR